MMQLSLIYLFIYLLTFLHIFLSFFLLCFENDGPSHNSYYLTSKENDFFFIFQFVIFEWSHNKIYLFLE